MKKVERNGLHYTYETPQECEARLKKIALNILAECKSENLTVDDYYRMTAIAERLMKQRTTVNGQFD